MKVKKVQKAITKSQKAYERLVDVMGIQLPSVQEGNEKKLNKLYRRIEAKALALADAVGPAIQETDPVTDEN